MAVAGYQQNRGLLPLQQLSIFPRRLGIYDIF